MAVNADKRERWTADIQASVDLYNRWYMDYTSSVFTDIREEIEGSVLEALDATRDFRDITAETLRQNPGVVSCLRMACSPPLAVDRLVGLAQVAKSTVTNLEKGTFPSRMDPEALQGELEAIAGVLYGMLDRDLFPWLDTPEAPEEHVRRRAAAVVADRVAGAKANPVIRNAQETRQLEVLAGWLEEGGYRRRRPRGTWTDMAPGTYALRLNVKTDSSNVPVDVVVQPHEPRPSGLPILIEAKSAGDFTNPNKRRKEEAAKMRALQRTYGPEVEYILFLGGYFAELYLEYEAAAGLDWVWEHRIEDLSEFGV